MNRDKRVRPTNGAIALIDEALFEQLLDLPEDVSVRAIYLSEMRRAIVLHLVGDRLPPLVEGQEAERVQVEVEVVRDDDGRMRHYVRLCLPQGVEVDA
ncbi:MAG: hypothetical protein ACXWQR_21740 [Ktedonobacterales bacterium]